MSVKYFLGANSSGGFHSLYDGFASDVGDRLHLIKGGPGCGKSGFMKKLADAALERELDVEYILCSGDPDSLDGVYFPELKVAYADATAPHVMEPRHFGYDSDYVNLGVFCAECDNCRIPTLTEKYRAKYKEAYSYLAAVGNINSVGICNYLSKSTLSSVKSCAKSAASLTAAASDISCAKISYRFISSVGCSGELVLTETVEELCKQIYLIDDRLGLSEIYFSELIKQLSGRVVCCLSPLLCDRIEALLLPDEGIGFVAASLMPNVKAKRRVRLDALVPRECIAACSDELLRRRELTASLKDAAICSLKAAKAYHDELESCYRSCIDFDALNDFTDTEIQKLFG